MPTEPSITLLHLSDLQFGPKHRFEPGELLKRLREDLDFLRDKEDLQPELILMTGDLSENGYEREFNAVRDFAENLAKHLGLDQEHVVLVPGNHDIHRLRCQTYFEECKGHDEPQEPYWPKLTPYADFFNRFYAGCNGISFTEEEPWSFFEHPKLKVVVAGLNSTMALSHLDGRYGFLGEIQIQAFMKRLEPYRERGFLRIAAVHHDLLRPPADSDRARQDERDLIRKLGPYLNLVVHGHLHEEQLKWLDNAVPVIGTGSAGIVAAGRPAEVPNQYLMIRVYADRMWYGSRAYFPDRKSWAGNVRVDPEREGWRVERKVQFVSVQAFSSSGPTAPSAEEKLARIVKVYRHHVLNTEPWPRFREEVGERNDIDDMLGCDLLKIFVPQRVCQDTPQFGLPRFSQDDEEMGQNLDESLHEVSAAPRPVQEVLTSATEPWVLLLGASGAGKSALTLWLTLKLCAPGESIAGLSPEIIPVRIDLKAFDELHRGAHAAGRGYDFFDYLDDEHRERSLDFGREALETLAKSGRILWIFDAMDEVGRVEVQRRYAVMIIGLKHGYPCRGIVTRRLLNAEVIQRMFQGAGIPSYTILDFNEDEINRFVAQWYEHRFPAAPEEGRRWRERLHRMIHEVHAARHLCGNPWRLTLIARSKNVDEISADRHWLYNQGIERALPHWQVKRKRSNMLLERLSPKQKRRFLGRIAWSMMRSPGSRNHIREAALLQLAADFCCKEFSEEPRSATPPVSEDPRRYAREVMGEGEGEPAEAEEDNPIRLVKSLIDTGKILIRVGTEAFEFGHITQLWCLAASDVLLQFHSHAMDFNKLAGIFRDYWQNDAWEDVLTMICGELEEDEPGLVVRLLQEVLETAPPFNHYLLSKFNAFAVRCLAELERLDAEPIHSFALALGKLIRHQADAFFVYRADRLLSALRLCGDRWPGTHEFRIWMLNGRGAGRPKLRRTAYECAVATSSRVQRSSVLSDLLFPERPGELVPWVVSAIIEQAAELGDWDDREIQSLVEGMKQSGAPVHCVALVALLNTGAASVAHDLAELMRRTALPEVRLCAARALLKVGELRQEALTVLLDLAFDQNARNQLVAISDVVGAAASDNKLRAAVQPQLKLLTAAVIEMLSKKAASEDDRGTGYCLENLRQLAKVEVEAEQNLQKFLRDPRSTERPILRFYATQIVARGGDEATAGEHFKALTEREGARPEVGAAFSPTQSASMEPLQSEMQPHSLELRRVAAEALYVLPKFKSASLDALFLMAQCDADRLGQLVGMNALGGLAEIDSDAEAVLRRATEEGSDNVKLLAEQALVRAGPAGSAERRQMLMKLAARLESHESTEHQEIRVGAAVIMRNSGTPSEQLLRILTELRDHVREERLLLDVLKALGDDSCLRALEKQSLNQRIRSGAKDALNSLTYYETLRSVGKGR